MIGRLADEDGFSLVELLAAMVVAAIVLFALFGLYDNTSRQQSKAVDRVQSNARGRIAMDRISQELRSRVCLGGSPVVGSLVSASATQVEFYASLTLTPESTTQSQRLVIERRRLTYRPAPNNDVIEENWVSGSPAPALPPANGTTPTTTRTILTNVALITNPGPPAVTIPFFSYFSLLGSPPVAAQLTAPLSTADLAKAARIDVSFATTGKVAGVRTPLQDQILDRSPGCYFG